MSGSLRRMRFGGHQQAASQFLYQQRVSAAAPPSQRQRLVPRVSNDHQIDLQLVGQVLDHADRFTHFKVRRH